MIRLECSALLLDLDGTLIDSSVSIHKAYVPMFEEFGLDAAEVCPVLPGRRAADVLRQFRPHLDESVIQRAATDLIQREIHDTEGIVGLPGARDLCESLPPNRWAIVTSCVAELAQARMQAGGIPVPDVLVTADQYRQGKPDPEGFLLAASLLNVEPSDCVVVEDAVAGVEAAYNAGMRCVAVTTTASADALAGAVVVHGISSVRLAAVDSARLILEVDELL